jgi:hypothetical protein
VTSSAFKIDVAPTTITLLIDSSMLDAPNAVRVTDEGGVVDLGLDAYVRVMMDEGESEELWKLLDSHVGQRVMEREAVRKDFEHIKAAGHDTRLPSHEEYKLAREIVDEMTHPSDGALSAAQEVITVYEAAHGLRERRT